MKRIGIVLMALVMLVGMFCMPAAARTETDVTLLHDCDKAFGTFVIDKSEYVEGEASLRLSLGGGSFANAVTFDEVDVSEADTLAFELYLSDLELLDSMTQLFVEISSAGICDKEELQWDFLGNLKETAQEGWNTVYVYIASATNMDIDMSAVDYFRIYAFYDAGAVGKTLRIDNIRMCYTGGEDFSDMELDAYMGKNPDAEISISGQETPDLANRDAAITVTQGLSDGEEEPDDVNKDNRGEENEVDDAGMVIAGIVVVAVLVVAVGIVLAVVITKKKKHNA